MHPVAGETFDGAGGNGGADEVLVHIPTVANVTLPRDAAPGVIHSWRFTHNRGEQSCAQGVLVRPH